jgi:dipeptidase E
MRKIVAVGGGSIGWGGTKSEVLPISREIVRLSGKSRPHVLFFPTASLDDKGYIRAVQDHFGRKLNCRVETLLLIGQKPSFAFLRKKILGSDVIYVGGGNTLRMMNLWRKWGVDRLLSEAQKQGKVLCGTSAGAICWFREGNSDSRRFRNPKADLIKVKGLGFVDALGCPHYDAEKDRKPQLKKMMRKTPGIALAVDNRAALEILGNRYRVLSAKSGAGVTKVYWRKGAYYEIKLAGARKWGSLEDLLSMKAGSKR